MNNPFTGQFQKGIQERSQMKQELEMLYNKCLALAKLHHQLRGLVRVSAAHGESAADLEQCYREAVPNEEDLLRAILESTCSSIFGEQPMPADQMAEDEAILAVSDVQEKDEACGTKSDGPEPKRPRMVEEL